MPLKDPAKRRQYATAWRNKNRERFREYGRAWKRRNPEKARLSGHKGTKKWVNSNPAKYLWVRAKHRAKKAGLPFNIAPADIKIPARCPVLGLKLTLGKRRHGHSSPSVDRFIPKKGYVKGNVFVISFRANVLKRDATKAEIKALLRYMEKRCS